MAFDASEHELQGRRGRQTRRWRRAVVIAAITVLAGLLSFLAGEARVGGLSCLAGQPPVLRVRGIELIGPDGSVKGLLAADEMGGSSLKLSDHKTGSVASLRIDPKAGEVGLLVARRGKSFAWLTSDSDRSNLFLSRPGGGNVDVGATPSGATIYLDSGSGKGSKSEVAVNGQPMKPATVPTQ